MCNLNDPCAIIALLTTLQFIKRFCAKKPSRPSPTSSNQRSTHRLPRPARHQVLRHTIYYQTHPTSISISTGIIH